MSTAKKRVIAVVLSAALATAAPVQAGGIPVIDGANLAQSIQQVIAWGQQYEQMVEQIGQLKAQYDAITGIRNMGDVIDSKIVGNYIPQEYQQILQQGVGQWKAIRDGMRRIEQGSIKLDPNSTTMKDFEAYAKQVAIGRAAAEEAYKTAGGRFGKIQTLIDKINRAPDAKDIADLQARIQAEQVMMQNESNRLQMLAHLSQMQRDVAIQQSIENQMNFSGSGGIPAKW